MGKVLIRGEIKVSFDSISPKLQEIKTLPGALNECELICGNKVWVRTSFNW